MKELSSNQLKWIISGYETFANEGPNELKIERLAKSISKNKSSFYHYFADLEVFRSRLLQYHIGQAKIVAEKEAKADSSDALIQVILDHKTDILFNRQLRIHRQHKDYEDCLCTVNEFTIPAIMQVWAKIINLEDNTYLARLVLNLSLENFYLQINESTLNYQWLHDYVEKLKQLIRAFRNANINTVLDGTV